MFYDILLQLCEENNIKVTNFIKELHMSSGSSTNWKNGTIPNSRNLKRIAERFNVSTDYLLGNTLEQKAEEYAEHSDKSDLLDQTPTVTDDDIKFALFGDTGGISDEAYNEVKQFAKYIQSKYKDK